MNDTIAMNKQQKISHFKQIASIAETLQKVAKQQYHEATRLKDEADSALNELVAPKGRTRKGEVLTDKMLLDIDASLLRRYKGDEPK